MSPTFLQIVKDHTEPLWCISLIAMPNPGYSFLIVCDSLREAQDVVLSISNDVRNYPTVDPKGYKEITSKFPALQNITRVFKAI